MAGLFLGVAGGALVLSGRRRVGLALALSAMVPTIAVSLAFDNGGRQSFGQRYALMSFLVCLIVAGLVWRRPVIRWGALLSAGLIAAAYVLPTPVGTTAARLPELFAAPIDRGGRYGPPDRRHCRDRSRSRAGPSADPHRGV